MATVEFTVSRNGKFFFRVEEAGVDGNARDVAVELRNRFPETDGFNISVVVWPTRFGDRFSVEAFLGRSE